MPSQIDATEIDLIKDFLKEKGYFSTLECFIKEDKYKQVERKNSKNIIYSNQESKFTLYLKNSREKFQKYAKLEDSYKLLEKKYKNILQLARQAFSVSINCIELLQEIKNGNKKENLEEIINDFKLQIGKYHKILMNDSWDEKTKTINQAVMTEHKNNLKKAKEEKKNDKIIETLLSLRVYSLQISPELRRNLVEDFIENDILNIKENNSNQFILDLLNENNYNIKHAILSFISILASISKGVEYLNLFGTNILEKVIEIMKGSEDGQVLQRFSIAFLQKMSIKESNIQIYLKYGLIDWIVKLLIRNKNNQINLFLLDFSTALLANILQSKFTLEFLENNIAMCKNLIQTFLNLINDKIHTSVLMHLLICLNCLNNEKFNNVKEECNFNNKIKEFKENYINKEPSNDSEKFDKKIIVNLCNNLFDNKNNSENSYESKFLEYENEQKELIFECFQDEVN